MSKKKEKKKICRICGDQIEDHHDTVPLKRGDVHTDCIRS